MSLIFVTFCSNGVGRSGTFCVLMYSLNQFKAEQKAEIFQTVKKMRTQRAGIVETLVSFEHDKINEPVCDHFVVNIKKPHTVPSLYTV